MKKSSLIMLIVSVIIIIGGIYLYKFFYGSKNKLAETEKAVYNYLIHEKNYKESEIKSIEAYYSWKHTERNAYAAYVVFEDDPESRYLFIYNKEEGIRERGSHTRSEKHD